MRISRLPALLVLALLAMIGGCGDGGDHTPGTTVSIANLNVLHGFDCDPPVPADGDQCRAPERIALLRQHLIAAGCPDLVTLQEIVNKEFVQRSPTQSAGPLVSLVELIEAELPQLAATCGFTYHVLYAPFLPSAVAETDEELLLSRYPILQSDTHILHSAMYDEANGFLIFARHLLYARIEHPAGEVDVYTTHLSSGSDAATNSCDSFRELLPGSNVGPRVSCPAECDRDDTVRACQAEQLALYVEQTRGADNLALVSGDFNAVPGSSEYRSMTGRGWLDTHLAGGAPECDGSSGIGCSGGRGSSATSLESPARGVDRRIDYIFAALPAQGGSCTVATTGAQPASATGTFRLESAGPFAADANPFAPACGAAPDPICWVSDHSGNLATLWCKP